MKWSNRGHELDDWGIFFAKKFKERGGHIYIFGAGILGNTIRPILEISGCFAGYIDNDSDKQLSGVHGAAVVSLREYLDTGAKGLVVIAADVKNIPAIEKQLLCAGLKKEEDFYIYDRFMSFVFPVLLAYAKGQIYVELAQICLTERCSLKCRKCAHGCYAVDAKSQDMSVETAKKSADYFFSWVDVAREFVLIGGEPFLYAGLDEVLEYIGEKYRNKMAVFSITTNGTIQPKQTTLDLCKKYGVTIRISNYSAALGYLEKKYTQLQEKLSRDQVVYVLDEKDRQWMDYGFETVDRKGVKEDLIRVFDRCGTPCREIRENRYYYCVMARSVSENLGFGLGEKDYLDLAELDEKDRKTFLEFQMGFSQKGYLDMCNHCRGSEAQEYPIPAAEQV